MSSTHPLPVTRDLLSRGRPATTRRVALRSGALALTVAGGAACDASGRRQDTSTSAPSGSATTPGDDGAGDDGAVDAELAVAALGQVDGTLALLAAIAAAHPEAALLVDGLVRARQAHRDLLADAAPEAATPEAVTSPPDAARAWTTLRRSEQDLQAGLGSLALRARSGAFARVLAVMAASVAQHLAALPATLASATPPTPTTAPTPTAGPAA